MKKKNLLFSIIVVAAIMLGSCQTTEVRELSGYKFENEYAETDEFSSDDLSGSITIDVFIMLHEYPSTWTALLSKFRSDSNNEFNLRIRDDKAGQWYFGDGRHARVLDWKPADALPLDEWVRLTAVRDVKGRSLELFINGELIENKTFPNMNNASATNEKIYIARTGRRTLNATIAEIRIWSKALNAKEIADTYNVIKRPEREKELFACWLFDNVEEGIVKDLSANNRDLRIISVQP